MARVNAKLAGVLFYFNIAIDLFQRYFMYKARTQEWREGQKTDWKDKFANFARPSRFRPLPSLLEYRRTSAANSERPGTRLDIYIINTYTSICTYYELYKLIKF